MDSTKPTSDEPATPGFGIARDLQQLKTHSAASVAELREFLAQMRGRRPQEVLGLVAGQSPDAERRRGDAWARWWSWSWARWSRGG